MRCLHLREDTSPVVGLQGGVVVAGIMMCGEGIVSVPLPIAMVAVGSEAMGATLEATYWVAAMGS